MFGREQLAAPVVVLQRSGRGVGTKAAA